MNRLTSVLVLLLLALGVAAYWPALLGFFLSDDFVHVQHMQRMDEDIHVLLKNFWSNWLDVPTTLFYRPLVSVTLYLDHLLWGWRPVGYHLTNMLMHAPTGALVFLIAQSLAVDRTRSRSMLFPFLGAALFLLSPLHPEAVYWIIGRVDVQLALFYLLGVYLFLRHAGSACAPGWLAGSLLSFVAALMTKEPAVTLPAVLAAYSFFFLASSDQPIWRRVATALRATAPFWVMLALYFLWRRHVLGTFGGGYTGGGTDYFSLDYWERWKALVYLILPINKAWPGSAESRYLMSGLFLAGWSLLAFATWRIASRAESRGLWFGLAAFVLSLLPLMPVFNVAGDLQSSRFLYLPATFVWIALAAGLGAGVSPVASRRVGLVAVLLLLGLSAYQLLLNLQPWMQASREIRVFSQQLDRVAAERARSGKEGMLVLAGIPDNIHGAQFLRNGYGGFLGSVFHPHTIDSLLPLTDHDRTGAMPIHARNMAAGQSRWLYGVYRYFPTEGISQVAVAQPVPGDVACTGTLGEVSELSNLRKDGVAWQVTGPDPYLVFPVDRCHADAVDALRVSLAYVPPAGAGVERRALQAYWSTHGRPFSEERSLSLPLQDVDGAHEYILPVGSSGTWDAGQALQGIRFDFPSQTGGQVMLQQAGFMLSGAGAGLPQFPAARLQASDLSHVSRAGFDAARGVLALEFLKKDEFLLLPRQTWDPLQADLVAVRMRVWATKRPEGSAKLYWTTDKSPDFSEDKSAKFTVKADGQWHSYSIPLKHLPTWWTYGEGRQLRLNPYVGYAKVEIASIGMERTQPQPQLALLDKEGLVSQDNPNAPVFRRARRQQADLVQLAYRAVDGYAASVLEVSAQPFAEPNLPDAPVTLELRRELSGSGGVVGIEAAQFGGPGMRYFRIVSVDASGKPARFASDPVAVLIED